MKAENETVLAVEERCYSSDGNGDFEQLPEIWVAEAKYVAGKEKSTTTVKICQK